MGPLSVVDPGRMDARTLQALQRVTDAALAYLPNEELLQELLQRVADIMGVDTVAILLLQDRFLHARAAKGIEEEVEQGVRIPLGGGFAGRIAAERRPIIIDDVDHADILNPILREKGIRSLLGVPLLVEGRVTGVLHVGSLTPRKFTQQESNLLQLAADRAALAIERAQLFEQRRVAEAMQRRLLPGEQHSNLGLDVGGRYLPATGGGLGGDWYDVFPVAGGRIGLVVGDVVGHGVEAAAVMGQLRTAVRAYAVEGHSPAEVADRVNALMTTLGPSSVTTLAYLVLSPEEESLEIVNAGHPLPLMLHPDGEAEFIEVPAGIPLGAMLEARYRTHRCTLPAGATILLYTDGLVERRGESIDVGMERLRGVVVGHRDVSAMCDAVVEHLVPASPTDDIAFIAARLPPPPDFLDREWPARLEHLAEARHVLRRWLHGRTTKMEAYDVLVASQEACANAIEHAYGPGGATFALSAHAAGDRITIRVRDRGQWRAPRGEGRGRGLQLMQALMDSVDVHQSEDGTEVEMHKTVKGDE